jgi:lysine 2,3-aminomutase
MMTDLTERLGASLVQHGPGSDRVYLMELAEVDLPELVDRLGELARRNRYGKVIGKVPADHVSLFERHGYVTEALVPGFFGGRVDGHFMAKYLDRSRSRLDQASQVEQVLAVARERAQGTQPALPAGVRLARCGPDDVGAMAELYRLVFPSYPFPIHEPSFLAECMADHVFFMGAWQGKELVALASAEQYLQASHAELTDFATLPDYRRRGLAGALLREVEGHARSQGFALVYTIARALSAGMNVTFARGGYDLGGTLINNTQISGRIETMNVWYKLLK